MADTAIPIPDDAEHHAREQVQALVHVSSEVGRLVARDVERMGEAIRVMGRVLGESMERSAQRWRVRSLMPALTVRNVLVHGYVPYKKA